MARLACWAGRYSDRVVLADDDGLLLEIGRCLRLFGGADSLRAQLAAGLAELGYAGARLACAGAPQAALWLAEAGGERLDELPLAAIRLPAGSAGRLARFGLKRLGELRRLPSAALGRRLGRETMELLARAYGKLPDPRPDFVFPLCFDETVELPAPVEHAEALRFAARRLIAALAGWLAARRQGLRHCRLELRHRRTATDLELRFGEAHRDGARLERVLKERIERLPLAAPVEALRLVAASVEDLPGASGGLFDARAGGESFAALAERLRARLGEARVYGLLLRDEYRPECATGQGERGAAEAPACAAPRPFWLLSRPEPLAEVGGRPCRGGPLRLLAGPERIESGWWDGGEGVGDLRRDYFVALTADHRWAWLFREIRAPGGWFLHGWFA